MKNITLKSILILIMMGLYLSGCGIGEKSVFLTYKFDPDKKYHFVYDSKSAYKAYENNKLVFTGDSAFSITYTQEVVEIIDSVSAQLRFTYSSGAKSESDTWSTEYVMMSNGEIRDILDNDNTESLDYYRKLFDQTSPNYPSESVAEGFVWKHTVKVLLSEGLTDAETTYKVRSIVREAGYDCAVIEYNGEMLIPLSPDCNGENTVTTGEDRISVDGVVYFAYIEGIIIKEEAISRLIRDGVITIDGANTSFKIEEDRSYKSLLVNIE